MSLTEKLSKVRIGVTGSPASGKKSVSQDLAKLIGLNLILINDYAIKNKYGRWRGKEFDVDTKSLYGKIDTKGAIVAGHLLPFVLPRSSLDFVAVLRCSPSVLRKRYTERGYSAAKSKENVDSEILGVISYMALETFGERKVSEFDTSRTKPATAARKLLDTIIGKIPRQFGAVDWLSRASSPRLLVREFGQQRGSRDSKR